MRFLKIQVLECWRSKTQVWDFAFYEKGFEIRWWTVVSIKPDPPYIILGGPQTRVRV